MKTRGLFVILFCLGITSINGQGISFEQDLSWRQIKEKAARESKFIFIDVYATWCVPCKQMDNRVYTNDEVGKALNEKFIAIKLQQDQTEKDNAYIRSWYKDAEAIIHQYRVDGFPGFLFLSPEGKLLYRAVGYQDPAAFIRMIELALTDPLDRFQKQLASYKQGVKNYTTMAELIKSTREIEKDEQLTLAIAKDYKENYLDKLSELKLLVKEHLDFIGEFFMLMNSKDRFFKLCYEQPAQVDKVKEYKGWSDFQVNQTITREEVDTRLWKDALKGIPISSHPDWRKIQTAITKKYSKIDAKRIILDNQVAYYGRIEDYHAFANYRDRQIKAYPPKVGTGLQTDSWGLNVHAWMLFENSSDEKVLRKALSWSSLAMDLDAEGCEQSGELPNIQIWDTKANLLYKLRRVDEAIALEEKAIEQDNLFARKLGMEKGALARDFARVIDKMRKGEPTWPIKMD